MSGSRRRGGSRGGGEGLRQADLGAGLSEVWERGLEMEGTVSVMIVGRGGSLVVAGKRIGVTAEMKGPRSSQVGWQGDEEEGVDGDVDGGEIELSGTTGLELGLDGINGKEANVGEGSSDPTDGSANKGALEDGEGS